MNQLSWVVRDVAWINVSIQMTAALGLILTVSRSVIMRDTNPRWAQTVPPILAAHPGAEASAPERRETPHMMGGAAYVQSWHLGDPCPPGDQCYACKVIGGRASDAVA